MAAAAVTAAAAAVAKPGEAAAATAEAMGPREAAAKVSSLEMDRLRAEVAELERRLAFEERSGRNVARGRTAMTFAQAGLAALERCSG